LTSSKPLLSHIIAQAAKPAATASLPFQAAWKVMQHNSELLHIKQSE